MSEAENKPENENEETSYEEKDPVDLKTELKDIVKLARKELELKFKEIDKDSNGFIDKEEAKNIVDIWLDEDEAKPHLTEDEVKEFFASYDTNNDGKIDLDEFINSMADLYAKSIERIIEEYVP